MRLGTLVCKRLAIGGLLLLAVVAPRPLLAKDDAPTVDAKAFAESFALLMTERRWKRTDHVLEGPSLALFAGRNRKGLLRGHVLSGYFEPEHAKFSVIVFVCDTAEHAKAFFDKRGRRIGIIPLSAPIFQNDAFKLRAQTDGAGTRDRLHGYYAEMSTPTIMRAGETQTVQHAFQHETLVVEWMLRGLPSYDRTLQNAFIDYALARLKNPNAKPPDVPAIQRTTRDVIVRVEDPDEQSVPRAEVMFTATAGSTTHFRHGTCEDGFCELVAARRAGVVTVYRPTDAHGELLPLAPGEARLDADQREVVVRMPRGLSITGQVLEADGTPAIGVGVRTTDQFLGADTGPEGQFGDDAPVHTDGEGRFHFAGLPPGTHELQFSRRRLRLFTDGEVSARAGDRDVTVRLLETTGLALSVKDPDGQLVHGATVHVEGRSGILPRTGWTGRAHIRGLEPGRDYELEIDPPRSHPRLARARVTVRAGTSSQTVRLEKGWALSGVVTDPNGSPVAAKVLQRMRGGWRTARAKDDGSFTLAHLPLHAVQVCPVDLDDDPHPAPPGFGRKIDWTTIEPTDEPVFLTVEPMEPADILEIEVRGPEGRVIPKWRYCVFRSSSASSRIARGASVRIRKPKGPFGIEVYAATDEWDRSLGLAPAQRDGLGPKDDTVRFDLSPGASIRGSVLSHDGKPVGGAKLTAEPAGERRANGDHSKATTAGDGTFFLHGLLPEASYEIDIESVPPPHAAALPVTASPGESEFVIRLPEPVPVTVVDAAGKPIADASVYVEVTTVHGISSTTFTAAGTTTNGKGVAYVGRFVRPVDLHVVPPSRHRGLRRTEIVRWDGKPLTVTLDEAVDVTLTVHGGAQRDRGTLRSLDGKVERHFRLDHKAQARLRNLPTAPTYEIWLPRAGGSGRCVYARDVSARATMKLEAVPTARLRFRLDVPPDTVDAEATVIGPVGKTMPARKDAEGVFSVEGLPSGDFTWKVRAMAKAPSGWIFKNVELTIGDEPQRVVFGAE